MRSYHGGSTIIRARDPEWFGGTRVRKKKKPPKQASRSKRSQGSAWTALDPNEPPGLLPADWREQRQRERQAQQDGHRSKWQALGSELQSEHSPDEKGEPKEICNSLGSQLSR